jgi:hypothetical protein
MLDRAKHVVFLLVAMGCKGGCRDDAVSQPVPTSPSMDAEEASATDAGLIDAPEAEAGPLTIHRTAACTIVLDEARAATNPELVALLFPKMSLETLELPASPLDGGGFGVTLCNSRDDAVVSRAPRLLGKLTRIGFAADREVVQVSYGVQAGMVETAVGVIALVERAGKTVRATAFRAASGASEISSTDAGPYELTPIRAASFGATEAFFIEAPDFKWGEQADSGAIVSVVLVRPRALKDAGIAFVSHRSNGVFWRGPFRWAMKSSGMESAGDGYVVHEHWTLTNRTTKKQTTREVARTYRVVAETLVATPRDDLSMWAETRGDWDADTPSDDDPE